MARRRKDPSNYVEFKKRYSIPLIPQTPSFHLFPHQVTALNRLLHQPSMIYADKPGLGKTASAAYYMKMLAEEEIARHCSEARPSTSIQNFYGSFRKNGAPIANMEKSNLRLMIVCDTAMIQHWRSFFNKISPDFAK